MAPFIEKILMGVSSLFPTLNFFQVSQTMTSTLGVPVKLLHEALGHVITVELKTGQLYRGKLADGASTRLQRDLCGRRVRLTRRKSLE